MCKNDFLDCYTKCNYCQSWPDGYTCSHQDTFVRDLSGKPIQARECFYAYMDTWDERWLAHPCPFFAGEIYLKKNDGSNVKLVIHNGTLENYNE